MRQAASFVLCCILCFSATNTWGQGFYLPKIPVGKTYKSPVAPNSRGAPRSRDVSPKSGLSSPSLVGPSRIRSRDEMKFDSILHKVPRGMDGKFVFPPLTSPEAKPLARDVYAKVEKAMEDQADFFKKGLNGKFEAPLTDPIGRKTSMEKANDVVATRAYTKGMNIRESDFEDTGWLKEAKGTSVNKVADPKLSTLENVTAIEINKLPGGRRLDITLGRTRERPEVPEVLARVKINEVIDQINQAINRLDQPARLNSPDRW